MNPSFDGYLQNAPSEIKPSAQLLVDAARKAISTNDVTAFQTDSNLQAASTKADTFCGQASSSSPASASSSESSSSS